MERKTDQYDGIRVNIRNNRQRRRLIGRVQPTSPFTYTSSYTPYRTNIGDILIGTSSPTTYTNILIGTSSPTTYTNMLIGTSAYTGHITNLDTREFDYNSDSVFSNLLNTLLSSHESSLRRTERVLDIEEATYKKEEQTACSICCNNLQNGEKMIELSCSHVFHPNCITEWGKYKPACPNCRIAIPVK